MVSQQRGLLEAIIMVGGTPAGAASWRAKRVNIVINKQITACKDVEDLCSLIQNRVAEFNHVATAFRKLLQTPRQGVARGTVVFF